MSLRPLTPDEVNRMCELIRAPHAATLQLIALEARVTLLEGLLREALWHVPHGEAELYRRIEEALKP